MNSKNCQKNMVASTLRIIKSVEQQSCSDFITSVLREKNIEPK
jgi:hypothetical protein